MRDKIGKLPKIYTSAQALVEILKIAKDKRLHVLMSDQYDWLKLKMQAIAILADRGLEARSAEAVTKLKDSK